MIPKPTNPTGADVIALRVFLSKDGTGFNLFVVSIAIKSKYIEPKSKLHYRVINFHVVQLDSMRLPFR